jgi:predicted nucleotidyltransferase
MSALLDPKLLKRFIRLAGERLVGEWVLTGGTVLPLLGREHRSTVDIDLVGLGKDEMGQVLQLMKLAEELGLPVEAINQAGAYFLSKIPSFRAHLVVLHEGKGATIYRPDGTLYLLLKVARMSESDLQDCLEWLKLMKKTGEAVDRERVLRAIAQASRKDISSEKARRLRSLARELPSVS